MIDCLTYMEMFIENAGFERLTQVWQNKEGSLVWPGPFILPPWLETWWQVFGSSYRPYLKIACSGREPVGIAPLKTCGTTVTFMGSADICDYQDFVVRKDCAGVFFTMLLDEIATGGFKRLELRHVKAGSAVMTNLVPVARARGFRVEVEPEASSFEIELPGTFESYLAALEKKQRHELRRKLRRLSGAGSPSFFFTGHETANDCCMDSFLGLFRLNQAKNSFMAPAMEQFFRLMARRLAGERLLRFGSLRLDNREVAMVIVFDYNNTVYLYNSAYDPAFSQISPGLVSKVLAIRESIRMSRRCWDFLKGEEPYKRYLGGQKVDLYGVEIEIG